MVNKLLNRLSKFIFPLFFIGGLVLPSPALAEVYGGGNYGNCPYSQGCTSTGEPAGNGDSNADQPADSNTILLNDFDEYFTDTGKQLELEVGDVIYFDVTSNNETTKYSIKVDKVGEDFVDITVGELKLHINVGETKNIDVNGDGENDIAITLNSIEDGKASFTFKVLGASTTNPTTGGAAVVAAAPSSRWGLFLSIAAIIAALLIFLILFLARRLRKDKSQMPPS